MAEIHIKVITWSFIILSWMIWAILIPLLFWHTDFQLTSVLWIPIVSVPLTIGIGEIFFGAGDE
jgi:hypothetical protein